MRTLYRDMSEKGILFEDENGIVQFDKNFRFSDLNTAAQFLLHRGGDNTQAWTRENGQTFLQKKEPAEIPKNPGSSTPVKKDTAGQKRRPSRTSSKSRKPAEKAGNREPSQKKPAPPQTRSTKQTPKTKPAAEESTGKAEVRTYKANSKKDKELKPQEYKPEEKKQGFFRTLFGKKTPDHS